MIKHIFNNNLFFIEDMQIISSIKKDDNYKIYVRNNNNKVKNSFEFKLFNKECNLFLSWYSPSFYLITNGIVEYYYLLSDSNYLYCNYNIGKLSNENKSLPILVMNNVLHFTNNI